VFPESASGADLVQPHQAAVADDISRQHRCQSPLNPYPGHGLARAVAPALTYQTITPEVLPAWQGGDGGRGFAIDAV